MNPLIKWPGGKSGEIDKFQAYIPSYQRYIEPFFGGGALFFHLNPAHAVINDISSALMEYYRLIKAQDRQLYHLLICYSDSFSGLLTICEEEYSSILALYRQLAAQQVDKAALVIKLAALTEQLVKKLPAEFGSDLLLSRSEFLAQLNRMALDKMQRTLINHNKRPFSDEDLKSNLVTGFMSGYFMYFRKVYNDITLGRIASPTPQYRAANFYFIREYCYGSMFRYNAKGEFNIPYGGISYNRKNLRSKIDAMFTQNVASIFRNTEIYCSDFEAFLAKAALTDQDFVFLDPPYDTDFSDYEGRDFTQKDQERLANMLASTPAKFILIIKSTKFIRSLYGDSFHVLPFDNQYTYNVRSRNDRSAEHLIITNLPVS